MFRTCTKVATNIRVITNCTSTLILFSIGSTNYITIIYNCTHSTVYRMAKCTREGRINLRAYSRWDAERFTSWRVLHGEGLQRDQCQHGGLSENERSCFLLDYICDYSTLELKINDKLTVDPLYCLWIASRLCWDHVLCATTIEHPSTVGSNVV